VTTASLMRLTDFPLPSWKHRPGQRQKSQKDFSDSYHADHSPLGRVKALVPQNYALEVPVRDPCFLYGLDLHDSGYFWEAHEIWEAVWMASPQNGCDRIALRALIQITNGCLKHMLGQAKARNRLVTEALGLLEELTARHPRFSSHPFALSAAHEAESSVSGRIDLLRLKQDLSTLNLNESADRDSGLPIVGGVPVPLRGYFEYEK
jgi:Domain of unknown function (DUF309)